MIIDDNDVIPQMCSTRRGLCRGGLLCSLISPVQWVVSCESSALSMLEALPRFEAGVVGSRGDVSFRASKGSFAQRPLPPSSELAGWLDMNVHAYLKQLLLYYSTAKKSSNIRPDSLSPQCYTFEEASEASAVCHHLVLR